MGHAEGPTTLANTDLTKSRRNKALAMASYRHRIDGIPRFDVALVVFSSSSGPEHIDFVGYWLLPACSTSLDHRWI